MERGVALFSDIVAGSPKQVAGRGSPLIGWVR